MSKIDHPRKQNQTRAARAYDQRLQEVRERLTHLQSLVSRHEYDSRAAGIGYGHVGDLAHVASELQEIEQFLEGEE